MWVGKFKIRHECFILSKLERNPISILAYVLGVHEENEYLYYTTFLIPVGSPEQSALFVDQMKHDKQVTNLEEHAGQLVTLTKVAKDKKHISSNFSHELFLVEPILHQHGYEYWHIASWKREQIVAFYDGSQQIGEVEMLKLKEEKLHDIFYPRIVPSLSVQQKRAFELALERGYYDYPQKIHLEDLAKQMDLSRVSYREHLKKAQGKLLPFFSRAISQSKSL